jgi:hypothetical protein
MPSNRQLRFFERNFARGFALESISRIMNTT